MPAPVRRMLADYERLRTESPWDWGLDWRTDPLSVDEVIAARLPVPLARLVGRSPVLIDVAKGTLSEADAMRRLIPSDAPPGGTSSVVLLPAGDVRIAVGTAPWARSGDPAIHWLVLDSHRVEPAIVLAAGQETTIEPGAWRVIGLPVAPDAADVTLLVDGRRQVLHGVVERAEAAVLRLHADAPARWSVTDDRGGAWFPAGALARWDGQYRPFVHGNDLDVDVPAAPISVTVTRGVECEPRTLTLTPRPGATTTVEVAPRRRLDPAAAGWYGADLHVHPHYSGDLVVTPDDLASMQHGEGLHLLSVLAANLYTTRIYDREAFEALAGQDLPWSSRSSLARYGFEYRNDLLGHFHALAPSAAPSRFQTGHVPEEGQEDWPPNSSACTEARGLGATVGYAHPVWGPFEADGSPGPVFEPTFRGVRSVEARELVADAALGLVDSLDLLHYGDWEATAQLYHHLLGCGLRIAASVGTDAFLSFSHGLNSDPPGWARMYAHLGDAPLTAAAYKEAIRAGRTIATNGPWITLAVAGHPIGDVLECTTGDRLLVESTCEGPGVTGLEIIGADGVMARATGVGSVAIRETVHVAAPTWIAARASGVQHASIQRGPAAAHTSPVYVDVDGARVARPADAAWCLDWLDRFERLVERFGRHRDEGHRRDVLEVIEAARVYYRAVAGART